VASQKRAKGILGLKKIYDNLSNLYQISEAYGSREAKSIAEKRFRTFSSIACAIINDFKHGRGLEIFDRIRLQTSITKKYNSPVRPALDPYTSTTLDLYQLEKSGEIGRFFDYPDCCIKTFVDDFKITLEASLLARLGNIINKEKEVMVITSGFVPCNLDCKKAHSRGLIAVVKKGELERLKKLEEELFYTVPHYHPAYFRRYFEYLC
jgi:hypothetical protein